MIKGQIVLVETQIFSLKKGLHRPPQSVDVDEADYEVTAVTDGALTE